jgi:uncharacterized phage protein (TIGR02218 family)
MTIFSDRELSVHDSQPIECFEFIGSYVTYRYTSADIEVTVNGNVYTPAAVSRTGIRAGTHDEDNIQVEIEMPITMKLVVDYGFQITPPALNLTIYRVHRGTNFATDFSVYWKGPVTNIGIEDDKATFTVPSAFAAALSGAIPSIGFQAPCNRVLFDSGCKVSRGFYSVTTTVAATDGDVIQLMSNGGFADGLFIGGEIADTAHNDRRMIIAHSANLVTVNYPFAKLTVGTTVEVTAGCNHAFNGDCKNRFSNQINFGGFPFIPSINPFAEGL